MQHSHCSHLVTALQYQHQLAGRLRPSVLAACDVHACHIAHSHPLPPWQVMNEINARRINDEYNVFEGMHKSPIFLGVLLVTLALQVCAGGGGGGRGACRRVWSMFWVQGALAACVSGWVCPHCTHKRMACVTCDLPAPQLSPASHTLPAALCPAR